MKLCRHYRTYVRRSGIHLGFALSKIHEQEAQETLRCLRDVEQVYDDHFATLMTTSDVTAD